MKLCDACARLEIQRLPLNGHPWPPGYKLGTLSQVYDRAGDASCALCGLIIAKILASSYFAHYATKDGVAADKAELPVSLLRQARDSHKSKTDTNLHGFDVTIGPEGLVFSVELYALRGSPAAVFGDVASRDICMQLDPDSLTPSQIASKWLNWCKAEHPECCESFSGERFEGVPDVAPRRLLAITPPQSTTESPTVRLIEPSKPFKARYASLSHCWGPPEKRPLCTVKANLEQHKSQVPWSHLSQTFRDACTLCLFLDIEYIWIDSLCIVQDDSSDWAHEAAIMCRVYEESDFTIAASSAANSSQGLFGVRSNVEFVELPYTHRASGTNGVIYAYSPPTGASTIFEKSALSERGWVLQESVLARRTIHFTAFGVYWTCGREPGYRQSEYEVGTAYLVPSTWTAMIREYTKRDLTYKSDKLVAIKGLADAWAKRTKNTYHHGIFLEDLPYCLLWMGRGASFEGLVRDIGNGVPSWSWASTTGRIEFASLVVEDINETEIYCNKIEPSTVSPGALHLQTVIKEVASFHGPFECLPTSIEELRGVEPESGPSLEGQTQSWCHHSNHPERYFMMMDDSSRALGWGAFDEWPKIPSFSLWCLPLVKAPTQPWYLPPIDTTEPNYLWCLLVCHDPETDVYKRVGFGRLLDTSWIKDEPERNVILA
ncbi:heterokaryon incompatibility protein-domain-containing protein [Pestalotiopsis sp. NC0098]|nr:heterokaryon incompatibility protein-domain-containing protein [Pestalotiopsis sp. NC0098]